MNLKRRQLAGLEYLKERATLGHVICVEGQRGGLTGRPIDDVSQGMAFLRKRMNKRGYLIKWEHSGFRGYGRVKMWVQGRCSKYIYHACWHRDEPAGFVLRDLK